MMSLLCTIFIFSILFILAVTDDPLLFDHDDLIRVAEDSGLLFTNPMRMAHQESALLSHRTDLRKKKRAESGHVHEVVFAVRQKNIAELKRILDDVSDPLSNNYGRHMTKQEVQELTTIPGTAEHLSTFLTLKGATVTSGVSPYTEYLRAKGPVQLWEELFATQFFEFEVSETSSIVRAEQYSLPENLLPHVYAVFNTVQFPSEVDFAKSEKWQRRMHSDVIVSEENTEQPRHQPIGSRTKGAPVFVSGAVTPALINSIYNIANNTGNSLCTQALYETIGQTMSPTDLTYFQNYFNLPVEAVAANVGNHSANDACARLGLNDCVEANLDVQYIMAVAQNCPTTYYYWAGSDFMVDWITEVAALTNPPLVFSISYGTYEIGLSSSYMVSFDLQAMKLGVMGVTIVAASGDDGAPGNQARNNPNRCGYYPGFPASSQYVVAVGGTQGPESGTAEIACQGQLGGLITTGGGFSTRESRPSYQTAAVAAYFANVTGTSKAPIAGYATYGRGFPDVSLVARNYLITANGGNLGVYGTSASAPVFAGFVSLVNAKRLAAGRSALGWINPSLYAYSEHFVNDITSGSNNCVLNGQVCCSHGYTATTGWDPVTGLGSVNYGKFEWTFLNLVGNSPNNPTPAPSVVPGEPTVLPTLPPSSVPSVKPTQAPTLAGGYLYQTTYSNVNCTGTVPKVQGVATNQCIRAYSGNTLVAVVKVKCFDGYAQVNRYLRTDCDEGYLYTSQNIFLGCAKTVNFRGSFSVSFTCSASTASVPIPSTGNYAKQLTYTGTSSTGTTNGCSSTMTTFVAFKENTCVNHYAFKTAYSYYFSYPNMQKYTGTGCSGTPTTSVASTSCAAGYLDQNTFSNYGYSYADDYVLDFIKAYSKWSWQIPTPTAAPTITFAPSAAPTTIKPSVAPTVKPSRAPTTSPTTRHPTVVPTSAVPTVAPTSQPTVSPTVIPTSAPSVAPTLVPSVVPSEAPTAEPSTLSPTGVTAEPTVGTEIPSERPTTPPTTVPTVVPTSAPTEFPTTLPSLNPSAVPTDLPTLTPSLSPTIAPTTTPSATFEPSTAPSTSPTLPPSLVPTRQPSLTPTVVPSVQPSTTPHPSFAPILILPSEEPTETPTDAPTASPTSSPTISPTPEPSIVPTHRPSLLPTVAPTTVPTPTPTLGPTLGPVVTPTTTPTASPTIIPTTSPTAAPTPVPTLLPTVLPSKPPTFSPTAAPTTAPTSVPTALPSPSPTLHPSALPTSAPPTKQPTHVPTTAAPTAPTADPSALPTLGTDTFQFIVTQTLSGVSLADYSAHEGECNGAVCHTAATAMGINRANCTVTSVSAGTTRRLLLLLMAVLSNPSVIVDYSVLFRSDSASADSVQARYDALTAKLVNSTSNGLFDTVLQSYATQQGLTMLAAATSAGVTTSSYSPVSSTTAEDAGKTSGALATQYIIIIAVCGAFVLAAAAAISVWCYRRSLLGVRNAVGPSASSDGADKLAEATADKLMRELEVEGDEGEHHSYHGVVMPFTSPSVDELGV